MRARLLIPVDLSGSQFSPRVVCSQVCTLSIGPRCIRGPEVRGTRSLVESLAVKTLEGPLLPKSMTTPPLFFLCLSSRPSKMPKDAASPINLISERTQS